jgi:hypothetical protein
MINHGRTLLLNLPTTETECLLEEYISPDFISIQLNELLNTIHSIIFASCKDRSDSNFRVRQLLTLIHLNNEKALIALDPRITYLPFFPRNTSNINIRSLPDMMAELSIFVREHEITLFKGLQEEFKLWKSPLFVDKLVSVILAFIYKVEELRRAMVGCQVLDLDRDLLSTGNS